MKMIRVAEECWETDIISSLCNILGVKNRDLWLVTSWEEFLTLLVGKLERGKSDLESIIDCTKHITEMNEYRKNRREMFEVWEKMPSSNHSEHALHATLSSLFSECDNMELALIKLVESVGGLENELHRCQECEDEDNVTAVEFANPLTDEIKRQKKLAHFKAVTTEMAELYAVKNKNYNDSFGDGFEEYDLTMPCIRLDDKIKRLKSLAKQGIKGTVDETIIDTLIDLANYSVMTIMEIEDRIS